MHNEAPRLTELQAQSNAVRALGQVLEDLKGNAVLERLNLLGNQVTEGLYLEPIEAEMDLKAYIDLCEGQEIELIKYRAALICHIGPCLHHLDGLRVSEAELETALDLEHRGELISFPSAMSSIELAPPSQDTSAEFLLRNSPVKGRHAPTNSAVSDVSEAFSLAEVRETAGKRERQHCNSVASSETTAQPGTSGNTVNRKVERGENPHFSVKSVDFPGEKPTLTGKSEDEFPQSSQKDPEKWHMSQKARYKESRQLPVKASYYHHYSTFVHSITPPLVPASRGRKHHCHCSKRHHRAADKENTPQTVKVLREVATSTRQSEDMRPYNPVSEEIEANRHCHKTESRRKGWKLSMETDVSSHRTASYGEEAEILTFPSRNLSKQQENRSKSIESCEKIGRNACRTPESVSSSANIGIQAQLVLYACTPSRPVLTSEASEPLHCVLSPKGSEFALLVQLLQPYPVLRVLKTYTYSQQRALLGLERPDSTFLARHSALERLSLRFHSGEEAELLALCSSPLGFQRTARFTTHVEGASPHTLLCLADLDLQQRAEDPCELPARCAVPVYLVSIASH